MQFRLAHGALEPEQQPVIEQCRVIEAIGIADQRFGEPGKVDEAIPFGIVARQARHFEAEHEADMGERHLGDKPGEAGAGRGAGAGKTKILIDDGDPLIRPAERAGRAGERVLPLGRFAIVLDLGGARLARIDDGLPREMAGRDLGALTHGSPR
jgi:hypothetical protein